MNLHQRRAFAAIEMGRWELALSAVAAGLHETPECADMHAAAAVCYCELELLDAAVKSAEKVVELSPNCDRGFRLLMDAYRRLGNRAVTIDQRLARRYFQKAIAAGEEGLRIAPESAAILANLSMILQAIVDSQRASALAQRAVDTNPQNVGAWLAHALTKARQGDKLSAEAALRTGLSISPDESTLHFNLAKTLFEKQDFRSAFEEARTALLLDPSNQEVQQLHDLLEQTESALVRGVWRINASLRRHRLLRCGLLISTFTPGIVLSFAALSLVPPLLHVLLIAAIAFGFFLTIMVLKEPGWLAYYLWSIVRWIRHPRREQDCAAVMASESTKVEFRYD